MFPIYILPILAKNHSSHSPSWDVIPNVRLHRPIRTFLSFIRTLILIFLKTDNTQMKVYFVFFIGGIAGNPFSVFNSTDLEIPELFNLTEPDGMNEMAGSGDDVYEWLTNKKINKKRMKNDKLNHPNNDCMNPDIIVHAGDIIDGISIYDGDFYRLFGNDGGSPYCINLADDEFVTSLMFGFHTHSYWAIWDGKYGGHLCELKIVTNQNTFGPFASWHSQCGNMESVQIKTTLESFLQTKSTISSKGMLLIET